MCHWYMLGGWIDFTTNPRTILGMRPEKHQAAENQWLVD